MTARADAELLEKLKALPPEQRAEVEDFVDFLAARAEKQAALDRLLAIAPEIKAARAERRARGAGSRADRS